MVDHHFFFVFGVGLVVASRFSVHNQITIIAAVLADDSIDIMWTRVASRFSNSVVVAVAA